MLVTADRNCLEAAGESWSSRALVAVSRSEREGERKREKGIDGMKKKINADHEIDITHHTDANKKRHQKL